MTCVATELVVLISSGYLPESFLLISPTRFPSDTGTRSGGQGSGSGSGRPGLYRDEGNDDLYQ